MSPDFSAGAQPAPEPSRQLEQLVHSHELDVLRGVAASPGLTEELALALLARRDLPQQAIADLSKNSAIIKNHKVIAAVVSHPRTPRHVSLPLSRHLHTFEMMQVALTPAIPADLKIAIEETLIARISSIASGERLSLARRGSTRVAAALLCDRDDRILHAALDNPYMTEPWIVKALMRDDVPVGVVHAVCRHPKWSLRRDVQIAVLRNPKTPLPRAIAIAERLPIPVVRDVLSHSRLDADVKAYLHGILHRPFKSAEANDE